MEKPNIDIILSWWDNLPLNEQIYYIKQNIVTNSNYMNDLERLYDRVLLERKVGLL
jgi:hypothetical protein